MILRFREIWLRFATITKNRFPIKNPKLSDKFREIVLRNVEVRKFGEELMMHQQQFQQGRLYQQVQRSR
jgi:hypothetical protein